MGVAKVDDETAVHECVSDSALVHLKSYKYSSVDKSFLTHYVLRHYWNGAVHLLPRWLAPNMVTLIGFFWILGNVILLEAIVPDMIGPAPSWVYYSFALGIWMYSTMDNLDGKQARRLGQSSGLGELFDHGIDSLNCTLASLLETAAMGLGHSREGAFTAMVPVLPMFFSTWETYHTHTLYLGYFNGPTEGLILACAFILVTAVNGPRIWHEPIASIIGFENLVGKVSAVDIWVPLIMIIFCVAHLPACIYHVVKARRARGQPVTPVFLEWIPMIAYTFACFAWLWSPYTHLLTGQHLVLWCLTQSFVFGRMTTKIILAHLTRQPFPYGTALLIPLLAGAVLINIPILGFSPISASVELAYLWSYFVLAAVVYARWASLVISSICRYLEINCLTVTPKREQPTANGAQSSSASKKSI